MLAVVPDRRGRGSAAPSSLIDEIVRTGERMRFCSEIFPPWAHVPEVHQGPRLPRGRPGHGVQADRIRPDHWRMVNAPHPVALAPTGATFINGRPVERTDTPPADEAPAGAAE